MGKLVCGPVGVWASWFVGQLVCGPVGQWENWSVGQLVGNPCLDTNYDSPFGRGMS